MGVTETVAPITRQAARCEALRQVSRASGLGRLDKEPRPWMFDNEIDWVTRLENARVRREARSSEGKTSNAFEYKAEHKQSSREQVERFGQVFK
jgi:hypothetical protein